MQPLIWGRRVRTSKEYQGLYYSDKALENRAKPQRKAYHCIRIQHGERAFIHFPPTPQSGRVALGRPAIPATTLVSCQDWVPVC